MITLGISGFSGKMGQRIYELAKQNPQLKVVVGLEREKHPDIGSLIGSIKVSDNLDEIKNCDCLIDFSMPQATVNNLSYLLKYKKCAVIGTTGLSDEQQANITQAAKKIAIVFSPNMSVGVNVFFTLVTMAAGALRSYTATIEETHHIHKKDAPSGTAKKIAQIINEEGFALKTEDIRSIRKDEIIGDHKIVFESDVDTIEITHSAKTRDIFAKGALLAAQWIAQKKNGLYTMNDVLSLNAGCGRKK